MRKPDSGPPLSEKRLAALHEASHVVTAHAFGFSINDVEIHERTVVENPLPGAGFVPGIWGGNTNLDIDGEWSNEQKPLENPRDRERVQAAITVAHAGKSFELLLLGRDPPYWRWQHDSEWVMLTLIPLLTTDERQREELKQQSHADALGFVTGAHDEIERFADLLENHERLDRHQIEAFFENEG